MKCLTFLARVWLASGSRDGTIKIWNLAGHGGWVEYLAVLELAFGRLASGSINRSIKIWDSTRSDVYHVLFIMDCLSCIRNGEIFHYDRVDFSRAHRLNASRNCGVLLCVALCLLAVSPRVESF